MVSTRIINTVRAYLLVNKTLAHENLAYMKSRDLMVYTVF